MNWTKTLPTQAGPYWWRDLPKYGARVLHVGVWPGDGMAVRFPSLSPHADGYTMVDKIGGEWWGPIPEPPEQPTEPVGAVWPDAALESQIRGDAAQARSWGENYIGDCGCHILVLLERVRALEGDLVHQEVRHREQCQRLNDKIGTLLHTLGKVPPVVEAERGKAIAQKKDAEAPGPA